MCGLCIEICPHQAIQWVDGKVHLNQERCTVCQICEEICPTGALHISNTSSLALQDSQNPEDTSPTHTNNDLHQNPPHWKTTISSVMEHHLLPRLVDLFMRYADHLIVSKSSQKSQPADHWQRHKKHRYRAHHGRVMSAFNTNRR